MGIRQILLLYTTVNQFRMLCYKGIETYMESIYLDHAASTPIRSEVKEAMSQAQSEDIGNPSSQHFWGRRANLKLEESRQKIATALGADRGEIYFVRGGTESNNLAIFGRVQLELQRGITPRVITSEIEHKAVLEASVNSVKQNGEMTLLPVTPTGKLDLQSLQTSLQKHATIISIMAVNNETGICLPIQEIADIAQSYDVTMHTDAVQACGKIPINLREIPVDLLSLSGHKICGPKGTGILFVRKGTTMAPLIFGGGQERGLRPGTPDVVGAIGISTALELSVQEQKSEYTRLTQLRDTLEDGLKTGISDLKVHGHGEARAPHISNVGIPDLDNETLLANLDMEGISVSSGSACTSGINTGSHVLESIYGDLDSTAIIRFSLGLSTSVNDIHDAIKATKSVVLRMQTQSD